MGLAHVAAAAVVSAGLAAPAIAQQFSFTVDSAASGIAADLALGASTAGTLIGNWNPDTNPAGTRTKPGINPFDPFGATENIPVPVSIGAALGGPINSSGAGGFGAGFNTTLGVATMSGLSLDLLSGGPASLPITLSLLFDGFRTRNPSSTYIGGFPIELPLGEAAITRFGVTQVAPGAGTLTPVDGQPGRYDFSIATLVQFDVAFDLLGAETELPGAPLPMILAGQVTLMAGLAKIDSGFDIAFDQIIPVGAELPEQPFDLPTILPPGDTAHLLLNLTLEEIAALFEGSVTLRADGVIVPAPGAACVLCFGAVAMVRGRRR